MFLHRVALFLMDYPNRERLKILGHARVLDARENAALADQLTPSPDLRGKIERLFLIEVVSFDWNCPQYITPRFTEAEVERAVAGDGRLAVAVGEGAAVAVDLRAGAFDERAIPLSTIRTRNEFRAVRLEDQSRVKVVQRGGETDRSAGRCGSGLAVRHHVVVQRVDGGERLAGDVGVGQGDAEALLQRDGQLERVDRIQPEPVRAEERQIVGDLLLRHLEHQVLDHHLFDGFAQVFVGHGEKLRVES